MLRFRALMMMLVLLALAVFGLLQRPIVIVQAGELAGGFTVTPSATGAAGSEADDAVEPSLLVAPSTGPAGTLHLIYAENLPPNTDYQVRIYLEADTAPLFETNVTSSTAGSISLNYQTDEQSIAGRYGVELIEGETVVASAMFQVTTGQLTAESTVPAVTTTPTTSAPEGTPQGEAVGVIDVDPPAGMNGTNHVLTVLNLNPGQDYRLVVEFDGQQVYEETLTADDNGLVGTVLFSEPSDPVGDYTLRLLDIESGAEIATGLLTIQNEGETPVAPLETDDAEATDESSPEATTVPDITATPAAPDQVPASGQRFEGELNADTASASFDFDGTAGQVISIRMTSADFDSYLLLADADDNILMRNDNSGGDFNAEINGYTLPADGRYTIVATARQNLDEGGNPVASGAFAVTLNFAREASGGAIANGETVVGELVEGSEVSTYTFAGEAGQLVTIDLASDAFDPFVILIDPNGQQVVSDDDSGPSLYARIERYQLTESGDYTIQVDGFRGPTGQREISGEYHLTLTFVEDDTGVFQPTGTPQEATPQATTPSDEGTPSSPDETPDASTGDAPIVTYGQPFEGELTTDTQTVEVQFEGSEGDVLDIALDSDEFDPNIVVIAPSGEEVGSDDDSGPGVNALLTALQLTETGTYTIVIDGYRGASGDREISGAFTLTLTSADGSTGPAVTETPSDDATPSEGQTSTEEATEGDTLPSTELGIVTVDEPVTGTFNDETQTAQYSFEANAGDIVTLDLTSSDFDPYVRLLDADGNIIAEDDDSGGNSQARLEGIVLPAAGEYLIEVDAFRAFNGTEMIFGDYTVTLAIEAGATPSPTSTGTPTATPTVPETPKPGISATSTLIPTLGPSPIPFDLYGTPTPYPPEYGITFGEYPLPPVSPFGLATTPLVINQANAVTFTGAPTEAYAFTFDGAAGTVLSLFAVYGDTPVDTAIALYSPEGSLLSYDDDSGANFNPEIVWLPLSQTGQYRVVIYSYVGGSTGTVNLYYSTLPAVELTPDGSQLPLLLTSKAQGLPYVFEGTAGQQMRLTVVHQTLDPREFDIQIRQGGNTISTTNVGGTTRIAIDFVVPQDGEVTIQFNYYGTGGKSLILSVEPVE